MANSNLGNKAGVNSGRLFVGSCFSLISTAVCFAVIGAIRGALKEKFVLTNEQVGMIAGAAMFGFTPAIFIAGPLCDALGMGRLLALAFIGHFAGVLLMIFAPGFWALWTGAFLLSWGNGLVEAVCNPLVATIYPDRKVQKLNQFHMWFPGGIVLGGLLSFGLDKIGYLDWRLKVAAILLPTLIYGFLFLGQKFPATERVQSGISFGGMCKATFGRPLFWLLLFCMMLTASTELGPQGWVPSVLQAGGIPGILVLVWVTGLMAVMRFFAGPVVHRFSPTGVLVGSAILAGLGLLWLSSVETPVMAFAAATVFALGVCYFWPTMIGVTAERVPKGGALAMSMMGGIGMLAVGMVTTPQMGRIADHKAYDKMDPVKTEAVMTLTMKSYPELAKKNKAMASDYAPAVETVQKALAETKKANGKLPSDIANVLRAIIKADEKSDAAKAASAILLPADNYGGRMSFRAVVPITAILLLIFGSLFLSDKARGGYKAEKIVQEEAA